MHGTGTKTGYERDDTDFFLLHVFPEGKFYVVPTDAVKDITGTRLYVGCPKPIKARAIYEKYLEAWSLIGKFLGISMGAPTAGLDSFIAETPFTHSVFDFTSRSDKSVKADTDREDYRNASVDSFVFEGTRYEVKYWKDVLICVTEIMLNKHRDQFSQVLSLVGRKRPYFTKDPNELRVAEKIDETDTYVEINVSANRIVTLSRRIIAVFGYSKDALSFSVQRPSES